MENLVILQKMAILMNCDFLPSERAKICILQEVTSERCNSDQLNTFFITSTYRHPLVMKKGVQLVRVASFRSDFLQNLYFSMLSQKQNIL
jgi:hypothetical protein